MKGIWYLHLNSFAFQHSYHCLASWSQQALEMFNMYSISLLKKLMHCAHFPPLTSGIPFCNLSAIERLGMQHSDFVSFCLKTNLYAQKSNSTNSSLSVCWLITYINIKYKTLQLWNICTCKLHLPMKCTHIALFSVGHCWEILSAISRDLRERYMSPQRWCVWSHVYIYMSSHMCQKIKK